MVALTVRTIAICAFMGGAGETSALAQGTGSSKNVEAENPIALQPFIDAAAERFAVPAEWICAVIRHESGGRTMMIDGRPIVSSAGALGPMQVMPDTYEEMRNRYGLGPDPGDPQQNILAGAAYMSELYARFGYTGMLAAYNAGPGRYQQFLHDHRPLPAETVDYLAALNAAKAGSPIPLHSNFSGSLFFPLGRNATTAQAPSDASSATLFVSLSRNAPE